MRSTWIEDSWERRPMVCVLGLDGFRTCRRRKRKTTQLAPRQHISTLFNTGQGLSEGVTDPNYLLTYSSWSSGFPRPANVVYNEAWTVNDAESSWIGFELVPFGVHLFTTTFDLTGFDPGTASLSLEFQVAGSDRVEGVFLNTDYFGLNFVGNVMGPNYDSNIIGPNVWHPLMITTGFQTGINTLLLNLRTIAVSGPSGIRMRVVDATAVNI